LTLIKRCGAARAPFIVWFIAAAPGAAPEPVPRLASARRGARLLAKFWSGMAPCRARCKPRAASRHRAPPQRLSATP